MAHERDIPYYEGEIENLAQRVGRLAFDQTENFIEYLANDLQQQSEADAKRGRTKLANELAAAAKLLHDANSHIQEAWHISAPYMTAEERGEDPA